MSHLPRRAKVEVLYEVNGDKQKRDNDRRIVGTRMQQCQQQLRCRKILLESALLVAPEEHGCGLTDGKIQQHQRQRLVDQRHVLAKPARVKVTHLADGTDVEGVQHTY